VETLGKYLLVAELIVVPETVAVALRDSESLEPGNFTDVVLPIETFMVLVERQDPPPTLNIGLTFTVPFTPKEFVAVNEQVTVPL
jgi:hypothetical protein